MKPDIIIHKLDEVNFTIECSDSIDYELREQFTFYVPNYQFMPAFKNRIWDGKIRLYDIRNHTLYIGLKKELEDFCKLRDYHYTYSFDELDDIISKEDTYKFIQTLDHKLEERDYQLMAVHKSLNKKRLILLSPTSSGKSKIIYDTIRYLQNIRKKVLIIVPTIQLVEQIYKDFEDYSINNNWNVEENCHKIYQGKNKNTNKFVTISTWQSIYTLYPDWFHQFDVIVGDEVHTFKSKSLTYIASNCINADYRIGLTGSLDDSQTHEMVLKGLFGPINNIASTKELMDRGYISNLNIDAIILKHPKTINDIARKWKFQQEIDYIIGNEARNKFIKNLAINLDGNVLILFHYVKKHGIPLFKMIEKTLPENKNIHFIFGGTDVEQREKIRSIVSKSKNNIIIASFGTTSTGINMPDLHYMIFASSFKARIKNLQSIGRLIRIGSDGSNKVRMFDIADDMRYTQNSRENYLLKHFRIRLDLYRSEKFDYKITKVDLKE